MVCAYPEAGVFSIVVVIRPMRMGWLIQPGWGPHNHTLCIFHYENGPYGDGTTPLREIDPTADLWIHLR